MKPQQVQDLRDYFHHLANKIFILESYLNKDLSDEDVVKTIRLTLKELKESYREIRQKLFYPTNL